MADPETPDDWLVLSERHESSARLSLSSEKTLAHAYFHAGFAVECALKAYIMKKERLNCWPDRKMRPELFSHDLRKLIKIAAIRIALDDKTIASWHIMVQWDRNQGYDPKPMPRRVAKSWIEAAFGKDGVVTWLRANLI